LAGATVTYNKCRWFNKNRFRYIYGQNVPANDAHGNNVSFNSPINKLEFYYNGPNVTAADPGGQIAGLTDLVWQDDEASGVLRVNGLTTNGYTCCLGNIWHFIIYNGSYTSHFKPSNPAVLALTSGQTLQIQCHIQLVILFQVLVI
jgi:hypothetical protein